MHVQSKMVTHAGFASPHANPCAAETCVRLKNARNDYEVNLKAELEIMALHEKMDALKVKQWEELIALQQEQIRLLGKLCAAPAKQD